MHYGVIFFQGPYRFFSVWQTSPPPSLQRVAFCGVPPLRLPAFGTKGKAFGAESSYKLPSDLPSMLICQHMRSFAGWGTFGLVVRSCYGYHFGGLNLPASPDTLRSYTITPCDWLGSYSFLRGPYRFSVSCMSRTSFNRFLSLFT